VADLDAYERRFRRAGLPLFIEDRSAREDVWTRAAPLLALVFIGEMLGAIQLSWPLLANVAAVLGGLAILLGAFGLLNVARRRRFWSLPEHVGNIELALFLLVPAALPLIFGGQVGSAALTLLGNALVLALAYAVIAGGLVWIVRWAGMRVLAQLNAAVAVLSKAVPLLLVFALVLFVNTEMWQVFSRMPDAYLALVGALLVGAGSLFVIFRLPREVKELEDEAGDGPELERRERFNVALVLFVSQALQTLVVVLAVTLFFVILGALAIGPTIRGSWEVTDGAVLLGFDLLGDRIEITEALVRVSAGIGAFAGLYYTIAVLTDSTYREEFLDELTDEMRASFAARTEYRAARTAAGALR
jgi:small neutral amino acid transporter SnatA (MarC family)